MMLRLPADSTYLEQGLMILFSFFSLSRSSTSRR